jgi:hypothetical protein
MSEQSAFNSFSTTSNFSESNSLVSKFAFILLIIFVFVLLLKLGISVLNYLLTPSSSPKLINGMIDASQMIVIPQDPNTNGSMPIYRSVNARDGIEFTWSVWIFISELYNSGVPGMYRHIFHKGNSNLNTEGVNFPNNAPGLYIAPDTNSLVIMMNTFDNINEELIVPDIPISKWVNVIIRCQSKTIDVYINGTIIRSLELNGVPKQNYGDVFVAMNGGFNGNISNLWYYDYALSSSAIQSITSSGPNTTSVGSNGINDLNADYLALKWYI